MQISMLKAKLHRACVTHAERDYEGSCAIDARLLAASGILEYEQIHIYNVDNGERMITYAIRADEDSRIISVNGAAAHKATPGDRIIICAYAMLEEENLKKFQPKLVYLDEHNNMTGCRNHIPVQVA